MDLQDERGWELRNGGEVDFGALSGLSLGEALEEMLDDGGTADSAHEEWALNGPAKRELELPERAAGILGATTLPQHAGLLRCIDDSHPPTCVRCTPAPSDPADVELIGDRGRKNGEKRLRSLMTRVPEWNLLSERRKLIPVAQAAGMASLADALETKKTSALRKAHLLLMAREWKYRSDIWSVRHDRAAERAIEEMKRRAAAPALPLCRFGESACASNAGVWDESNLQPEAVWLFTRKELRPLSLRVAAAFAGDAARAAAAAHGDAHITAISVAEVHKVAELAPGMLSQLGFVHQALCTACRSLPPHLAATTAWQALGSPPFSSAEAMLRSVLDAGLSQVSMVACVSARRLRRGGLSPGEAAWLSEMESSHRSTLALLNQVARVLNAFRSAPLEAFLDVAGTLLETLIVLVTSLGSAATSRERWMRDIVEARHSSGAQADAERTQVLVCWPAKLEELMEEDGVAQPQEAGSA